MESLELYAREGEIKARINRHFLERLQLGRIQTPQSASYYADVIALFDRIHGFVDKEAVLFVEELKSFERGDAAVKMINRHSDYVRELLHDLVNLHIDEPDGSFAVGLSELTAEFEQLIRVMRESLASLNHEQSDGLDLSHLQVLATQAA